MPARAGGVRLGRPQQGQTAAGADAQTQRDEPATRTVRDDGNLVIAAGTTDDLAGQRYRGWLAAMRRSRCGPLLNPLSHVDGEVFESTLPRSTRGGWPPGRALPVERGSSTAVQIAPAPVEPMDALTRPWAQRGVG